MRSRRSVLRSLVLLGVLLGCATGPRRPLFSFGGSSPGNNARSPATSYWYPPAPQGTPAPASSVPLEAPARPLLASPETAPVASPSATREQIDALVAHLREARGADRARTVEQLVKLGALSPADLEAALDDARFEADLLSEAETRLGESRHTSAGSQRSLGPGSIPEKKGAAPARWVDEKYRLALDRYLGRDYLGCLGAIDAILSLEANPTARPKLERLRRRAREQLVAETVIATSIVPGARLLDRATPLRARVLLENRTHDQLVLRPAPGAPLGQVVVDYEELLPDGTRSLRRATRVVQVDHEIRLGPGERLELPIEAISEHGDKEAHVLGRYRLSGRLRPYTLLAGEEPVPYFLPLFEVFVFVSDPDEAAPLAKPDEAFAAALEAARAARSDTETETASRRAFTAALVWAAQDRDRALAAIVAALEPATGPLARTLASALARATGEPGTYTKEEWLTWWKTAQSRPRVAHKVEEPSHKDGSDDEDHEAPAPGR